MYRQAILLILTLGLISSALADTFGSGANQFTIDFVTISGSTNPATGIPTNNGFTFTGVNNDYRMGTYEISNDQWNKFKAVYGTIAGAPTNAYDSEPYWVGSSVPTNNVSWYEAAQFVNFLNTNKGYQAAYKFTGTQGTSDYTFTAWASSDAGFNASNPYRNNNAFYFLPTENEWVKAAYWNGTKLQSYSNASPSDLSLGSPNPSKWNYNLSNRSEPWNVTNGVMELNGTFNMMGNVIELLESPWSNNDYGNTSDHCFRGGTYIGGQYYLQSYFRSQCSPDFEHFTVGFRVASIPEPCTLLLLGLGGLLIRRR